MQLDAALEKRCIPVRGTNALETPVYRTALADEIYAGSSGYHLVQVFESHWLDVVVSINCVYKFFLVSCILGRPIFGKRAQSKPLTP